MKRILILCAALLLIPVANADAPVPGNFGLAPNTVVLSCSSSSSNVKLDPGTGSPNTTARFRNAGSVDVFLAIAPSSALAVAVIPTNGSPAWGMAMAANSVETFSVPAGWYVACITSSSTASVYVTPGTGT